MDCFVPRRALNAQKRLFVSLSSGRPYSFSRSGPPPPDQTALLVALQPPKSGANPYMWEAKAELKGRLHSGSPQLEMKKVKTFVGLPDLI